jgi:hypothetical protein
MVYPNPLVRISEEKARQALDTPLQSSPGVLAENPGR